MVAYSFKPGFIPKIEARIKQQTIRRPRKRHALPGEPLQFFTGSRMRPTRLGSAVCASVHEVRLEFDIDTVTLDDGIIFADVESLDRFARRDGFGFPPGSAFAEEITPWDHMRRWWRMTHPNHPVFAGVMIDWGASFTAEPPQ